jgi:hypothetical protein
MKNEKREKRAFLIRFMKIFMKAIVRQWNRMFSPVFRSRKEPHLLVGAGAVTRCGSGSDNGIKHG